MALAKHPAALIAALFALECHAGAAPWDVAARRLFADRGLAGALYSEEVATGRKLAAVDSGNGALGLPLSAAKLFLAAIYFEHQPELPASIRPDIDLVISRGSDDAGRELALELRKSLGSRAMLRDLDRLGFPKCGRSNRTDCTTLSPASDDKKWSDALSLGEAEFAVTPAGLSHFLSAVGRASNGQREKAISGRAAKLLTKAMLETVRSGTARGSGARIGAAGALGGKTGSTAINGTPLDGLFAGLIFDREGRAVATVVTYVRRGGVGGGVAARISAAFGVELLSGPLASQGSDGRATGPDGIRGDVR